MDKPNIGEEVVKALFNQELREKPTFSDEMQKHIEEELQRMINEYNKIMQSEE
jgi:hypothetical protein